MDQYRTSLGAAPSLVLRLWEEVPWRAMQDYEQLMSLWLLCRLVSRRVPFSALCLY